MMVVWDVDDDWDVEDENEQDEVGECLTPHTHKAGYCEICGGECKFDEYGYWIIDDEFEDDYDDNPLTS